jgi:iron complex outermembrane recepter protein
MKRFETALRTGVALFTLGVGSAAFAQGPVPQPSPTAAPSSEIVITGSRIRHNALDQDAPRVFIDQSDIKKTGLNSINDVLQRLPSAGVGSNGHFNNSGNLGNPPNGAGVGAGAAEVDLRYLGSVRTLVLVDGLRFVNGASASGVPGSVDLNSIPASMIERVEVLQDGASSVYGSDAISGVVNIITKSGQKGFAASAQVGAYLDKNDGWSQDYELSWGNGTNKSTQIVIGGNYVKANGVSAGDRAISAFPNPYQTACDANCSSFPLTGRFRGPVFGAPQTLAHPITTRPSFPGDFRAFTDADRFNFAPFNYIEIPLKRYGVFANIVQEIAGDTHFRVKALWNRRDSVNQAAPIPLGVGPSVGNGNLLDTLVISGTNPYNPFGFDLFPNGDPRGNATNWYDDVRRRVIEAGPRHFEQSVKTYYGTATLDGHIGGAGDWYWDINGIYGRNKAKQTFHGNLNAFNVAQALGPVSSCVGHASAYNGQGTCVPLDLFGTPGSITQAMLDFIGFDQHDKSSQTTWGGSANISGKWFDVGGDRLGLAGGVEYRHLKGRFDPDQVVQDGGSSDIPAQRSGGGYNVAEVYGEFDAPFIKDRPGAELLELSGSMRYSHYKTLHDIFDPTSPINKFSHTTFKADLNYKPVRAIRLRASYAEGFRAPTIGELFGSLSRFDAQIDDPCSVLSLQPRNFTNDATVNANCQAHGVPAAGAGSGPRDQLSVATGGNKLLKPETSKSWVAGLVVNPITGFTAELNWYNIKIKGAIQAVDPTTTLNRCVLNNDAISCANVTRAPGSGNVVLIQGLLQNIAAVKTDGIDLNLAYIHSLPNAGTIGLTWNNTFLDKFDIATPTDTGNAITHQAGDELGTPTHAFPKWKSIGTIDWNGFGFGATLTGRYISHITEVTNNNSRIKSVFYTDAQLRWTPKFNFILHDIELAVGANNLFNLKTPGCISCDVSSNFDPIYDTPGRYYYARIGVKY